MQQGWRVTLHRPPEFKDSLRHVLGPPRTSFEQPSPSSRQLRERGRGRERKGEREGERERERGEKGGEKEGEREGDKKEREKEKRRVGNFSYK